MRTKKEMALIEAWDKQFPEYAPDALGRRVAVVRCVGCLRPGVTLCETCKC